MSAVCVDSSYHVDNCDWYVEQNAGIETIDSILARVGAPAGARVLDIGCGYGLSLDVACTRFGWNGVGIEPSAAGERGKRELGLDIRTDNFDDAFDPDERFDVILAIEVLEHVTDPRAFLAAIGRRLTPDGVVLLTTPNAAVVRPDTPLPVLLPALSIGGHEFLVDDDGLRRLLEDEGFVTAVQHGERTLWGYAARSEHALRSMHPDATTDMLGLVDYCTTRGKDAPAGSSLALGMAARRLKFAMAAAAFHRAAAGIPGLRTALRERYGMDLDDPASVLRDDDPPAVLVVVHFYVGLLVLLLDKDPARAADHFAAAAWVARAPFERNGYYVDPESPALELEALSWRINALAGCAPDAVPAAIDDLEAAQARTGATPHDIARLRALPVRRLAVGRLRRSRLALTRWRQARIGRRTHRRREAQQRRARAV
jgi:SAM-dependent methyltransferase